MKYTIKELSKIAEISSRTLRYYDKINLLKPCEINESGYRIYGTKEVDLLQQILFYRELELPLEKIKSIIQSKDFNCKKALYEHKENIIRKQERLKILLNNVERSIKCIEGGIIMEDKAKFEGLKMKMIKDHEEKYGKEIREKYGEEAVTERYKKFSDLSEEDFYAAKELGEKVIEKLKEAMKTNNISSEEAKETVRLHKKWLDFYGNYSKEAHIGLGKMYVEDERFSQFYDSRAGEGACIFLRDSIENFYKA